MNDPSYYAKPAPPHRASTSTILAVNDDPEHSVEKLAFLRSAVFHDVLVDWAELLRKSLVFHRR